MKKFLFGTTALIGAAAFATAAHAQGPAVNVGGHIDFQAGFSDQDSVFESNGGATDPDSREAKFANDTEIHISVEGRADNGLTYGAVVELEADVSGDADGEGGNADKTYIYLESNVGRVELGSNVGAQAAMKVDASTIARATGGIDGDWDRFIDTTGGGASGFILRPDLPSDHGSIGGAEGGTEDANKITYYSPVFSGFQVGVSFTPDGGDTGTASAFTGELNGDNENIFGLGVSYAGQWDQVGVQVAATGEFGDSEIAATEDLSAWQVGTVVSYQGFSIAGSWADWDDSNRASAGTDLESEFWTVGAAYETGPFGVSITYLDSEVETGVSGADNEFTNVAVGADYQLAPGLVPYVEVNFFDLDAAGSSSVTDNDGTVVLVGTELSF